MCYRQCAAPNVIVVPFQSPARPLDAECGHRSNHEAWGTPTHRNISPRDSSICDGGLLSAACAAPRRVVRYLSTREARGTPPAVIPSPCLPTHDPRARERHAQVVTSPFSALAREDSRRKGLPLSKDEGLN